MAGSSYDVLVNLLGNTSSFSGAMKKAAWDSATLGQKMQAIGGIMSSVGRSMTMYVTVPIVAGLALATKAAIDEEKEMALLAEAMRKNADATQTSIDATESWITAQQNATGIADGELRPALATLVAATKDVGEAQDLLTVAMDISAAKGKPLETVVAGLQKAYLGNVGALGRLGIATKDAEGKTLTFDQVMRNAIATYGGAAAVAAETTAGKFAILKAKMSDLVETVGGMFIPFVQRAVDLLTRLADWAGNLPPVWQQVGVAMAAAAAAAGPLLMILGKVISVIGVIMGIAGGGWIAAIIAGIVAIAAALGTLYAKSETFRNIVGTVWQYLMSTVQQVVAIVVPLLQELWSAIVSGYEYIRDNVDWAALWADIQPALAEVQAIIVNFVTLVVAGITQVVDFIRDNWSTIGPILKAAWDAGITYTHAFYAVVGPILGAIADILKGDWTAAWEHAKTVVKNAVDNMDKLMQALARLMGLLAKAAMDALLAAIKAGAQTTVSFVASLPDRIASGLKALAGILAGIAKAAMSAFVEKLRELGANAIDYMQSLPGKIKAAFAGAGSWLVGAGKAIIQGLINGIMSMLSSALARVRDAASAVANAAKDALGVHSPSQVFYGIGQNLMRGMALGIGDGAALVDGALAGVGAYSGSASPVGGFASRPAAVGFRSEPVQIFVDARGSTDLAAVRRAAREGARQGLIAYAAAKRQAS